MEIKEEADGGPAFPGGVIMIPIKDTKDKEEVRRAGRMIADGLSAGVSVLDFFAAAALTGRLAAITTDTEIEIQNAASLKHGMTLPAYMSAVAYNYAEAMLAERERRSEA